MLEKIDQAVQRYDELEKLLADPKVISDQNQYQKLAKEYSDLTDMAVSSRLYQDCVKQEDELKVLLTEDSDVEFQAMAQQELTDLAQQKQDLESKLRDLTKRKTEYKNRNLIFEIRAGTGGQEASLFAADLFRMYTKYADQKGWSVELISPHESETGGFKEVVFGVSGNGAERLLKWESGAHRVQRVPATETAGRIHTPAATVAVLFEPEEVDLDINPEDIKIDIFRSSGPGGQSVNTTDSAVRLTHLPTNTVVICQDERSQLKNKMKAMRVLRARIQDKILQDNLQKSSEERKSKVGTGDRSEKIRTYNYPDRRVTDHRIGFTTHKLPMLMDGQLDELLEAIVTADEDESIE